MSTLKPGTMSIRVTKGDDEIFAGRCDVRQGEDGTWNLTPVAEPPEEPPLWTLVLLGNGRVALREDEGERGWADYWVHALGAQVPAVSAMTWAEVCALGTPAVLEPESVKALREQVDRYDAWLARVGDALAEARGVRVHWSDLDTSVKALVARAEKAEREVEEFIAIDRAADAEDEPAEPAPVEVAEPEPNTRLIDAIGHKWHRTEGCRRWHNDSVRRSECLTWDDLREHHGPLTLVESP